MPERLAVGPAQQGRKHDERIYDESHLEKLADMLVLADLGYLGTPFETPLKKNLERRHATLMTKLTTNGTPGFVSASSMRLGG